MISSDVLPFFWPLKFPKQNPKKQKQIQKKHGRIPKKSLRQKGSLGASISVPAICFGSRF